MATRALEFDKVCATAAFSRIQATYRQSASAGSRSEKNFGSSGEAPGGPGEAPGRLLGGSGEALGGSGRLGESSDGSGEAQGGSGEALGGRLGGVLGGQETVCGASWGHLGGL